MSGPLVFSEVYGAKNHWDVEFLFLGERDQVGQHPADRGHPGREDAGLGAEPDRLHGDPSVGHAQHPGHRDVRAKPGHGRLPREITY